MGIKVHRRDICRICGGGSFFKWLCLPQMPLTDDLRLQGDDQNEFLSDINVYVCKECHTSQLLTDIDVQDYYRDYTYSSSASSFTKQFMSRLARNTFTQYGLKPGCKVIEVGSGDGLQLAYFKELGAKVYGIEPSHILCEKSRERGIPVFEGLFNEEVLPGLPAEYLPADVVLLTYTFDHMPEPMAFLRLVRRILCTSGLLIMEVHDLDKILKRVEYCLFEHEHLIYLDKGSMERTLNVAGFSLLTDELVAEPDRRGNSLLVVAKAVEATAVSVQPSGESCIDKYEKFAQQVQQAIYKLDNFVLQEVAAGRRIAGYGAGGRGVMTLAAMTQAQHFAYVCDQNENFHGKLTPKSHVPIVSPQRLQEDPVTTLLVFSYGYIQEVKKATLALKNAPASILSLLEVL